MTELVGILNVTPDSFSDGGRFNSVHTALKRFGEILMEGAAYVDIGAESTRPGAEPLTPDDEWRRLEPVLEHLQGSKQLSLDSYHPETIRRAREVLRHPFIINDVTGFQDPGMREVAAELGYRVILNHLPSGKQIQEAHQTKLIDTLEQVVDESLATVEDLVEAGVKRSQCILDPGIGFGKTPVANRLLLQYAAFVPEYDVMIGYSRKRFLGENRMSLAPNLEAGRIAVEAGARYLRVHDVAGHAQLTRATARR